MKQNLKLAEQCRRDRPLETHSVTLLIAGGLPLLASPALAQNPAAGPAGQRRPSWIISCRTPIVGGLTREAWARPTSPARTFGTGSKTPPTDNSYWMARSSKPRTANTTCSAAAGKNPAVQRLFGSVAVHAAADSLFDRTWTRAFAGPRNAGAGDTTSARSRCPTAATPSSSARRARARSMSPKSLDGPWEHSATVTVEGEPRWHASKRLAPGPSRRQLHVSRNATAASFFSDKGVLGPYKRMSNSVYPKGIPDLEDPCIWYSGGLYHLVVKLVVHAQSLPPHLPRRFS